MATVSLERLRKSHPGAPDALREVTLEIADGEFLSLVGPSGCGKSTTLNLIAGLDEPTSGTIRIGGREVNGLSPSERDVAMVFQSYALYPHKDVRGNLAFPLQMGRVSRAEIERRVAETAALLGIEQLLSRRPRELSGGQRQRVALGRALVRKPRVFLFDEPLSNLDAALRSQLRGELKRLHATLRATFVYVTHDQAEAMTLSDRIAVLREGSLQQVGPPREIYERPANRFVAEFFGTPRINVLPARAFGLGDGEVGIRPEKVELLAGPAQGALEGTVELCELTGAETWVTVRTSSASVVARGAAELAIAPGDRVWVRPLQGRILRFDASGAAQNG
ncbi:MAG TPA: ABC transporter ATP-binding protein [Myxococcales bacterium]|nr:ABC transporter ATP-binding protein [Myxococcales bacterium]